MTAATLPEPTFLYVGGDPALDLVNTVDWTSRGLEQERLLDFEQLLQWAEGAGVVGSSTARRLRHAGLARPRVAAAAVEQARRLRDTLHDLFGAATRGESAGPALPRFNRFLAEAMERMEITPAGEPGGAGYRRSWRGEQTDPRSVLWPVIWSAAGLLQSDELGKVRTCDGDDCGWMYVDRSRNGFRRWCQMKTCGTREKTRRRRTTESA